MPLLDWLNKPESLRIAARVPYRLFEGVPELIANHACKIGTGRLAAEGIVFKQIPYDVRVG